ncbi:ImpA family metalloprotease, partial [Oceanicoccus sp.]|uniref:ImpA family metalloprotease n=1 Tax=Oceanicoccus sp. TaxID=2691044 RepID=UPI00260C50F9
LWLWLNMTNIVIPIIALFRTITFLSAKPNIIVILADDLGFGSVGCYGATKVKSIMNGLDKDKVNIFTEDGSYRLYKLLALLGDKYRESVQFPMDTADTDDTTFMKSFYADHAVYNYRTINPAQPDMGNFSRSDFSHITPTSKSIDMESKVSFRSAGVYALPGQTVQITRTDNSAVGTKIFINSLRPISTWQYGQSFGYKRPKYLRSVEVPVYSGETISLTSPYGGPIQVQFSGPNDLPVSFTFDKIGEHPYWSKTDDSFSFSQKLEDGDYDWAELATPGFEVHSTLVKMRESVANVRWGTAEALAEGTTRYMHNLPHVLAGFQGPGIDVVSELHDFAETNGWTISRLDKVKHVNSDTSGCGYGCSGNPYDTNWPFDPIRHGDIHELGHGLQGKRRFNGWENHTMTNFYPYYSKSHYWNDRWSNPECQALPFERMFNILRGSVNNSDPAGYVQTNLWDSMGWAEGAGMFVQMMMAVQEEGILTDGWLLRARLHILEREYDRARKNSSTWEAKRDNLGFSSYAFDSVASGIDNNDWYLIALSYVTGRDFTDYLDMWGIPYSNQAKEQVKALGYPLMPRQYYRVNDADYCYRFGWPKLKVDGIQSW